MTVQKSKITNDIFVRLLAKVDNNPAFKNSLTYESLYSRLWANRRIDGGLRVSDTGLKIFNELGIRGYCLDIAISEMKTIGNGATLLALDRRVPCPYHVSKLFEVTVFDEREATVFVLAGSLAQYLAIAYK
jgi:hypothetical protein